MTGHDDGTDGGTGNRHISRRSLLRSSGAVALGIGATASGALAGVASAAPAAPTNLTVSDVGADSVDLTWSPGGGISVGDSVARDLNGDGAHRDLNGNGRLDSDDVVTYFDFMEDPAIQDNVTAFDYNGNERIDFDDVVTLFGDLGTIDTDSGSSVDHYVVYVDGESMAEPTDTTATVSGLSAGQTYSVEVTAVDGNGEESDPSDAVEVTPEDDSGDPSSIQPATTFDEFYTQEMRDAYEYSEWDQPIRAWVDYLPGEEGEGETDYDQTNWPDAEKVQEFEVDTEAVRAKHDSDETLTFDQMGTQALGWVRQLEEQGFPRHASAKLLARLSLLPDDTENLTYHNPPSSVWDETAGPVAATNDPDTLIQDPWPPDARSYQRPGWDYRDRAHDQPQHEENEDHMWYNPDANWTTYDLLPDDFYNNQDNPIHDIADKVHPATGEDLGGDGFTANAPMELEVKMHLENDNYWYQNLEFRNTSPVPYHLDAAVITWIGPMGANGNLRDGHYNNEQRISPGHGHPQRDVIEVVHDEEQNLSAYAIRLCFHDEPYNKRTAYPNQKWSLEVGMSANDYFSNAERRQNLIDTMARTCHVEVETDMDRNIDLLDALQLRNRMTN